MYAELILLLSGRTLDEETAQAKSIELEAALNEPEEWMLHLDPEEIRQLTVEIAIIDYVLIGDKIDELHELISHEFAEPLKPFPTREDNEKVRVAEYFAWLDRELDARSPSWELLAWDNDIDDNLHVIIVRRSDTDNILALAGTMGLRARRATDV
ncbi:hypothetical protein [Sphingomonas endophytica]|uniref:Uncharacterized protein n=1 Tax=Sphingomonas endophytica TaxID=869719 RepID=A0A147I6S8_9SPHN|nr:hypothetical protein [Sphingomonas endophytica]KTT74673.1 hypothetical protein NS334_04640 [Sphingomonas endophytica]